MNGISIPNESQAGPPKHRERTVEPHLVDIPEMYIDIQCNADTVCGPESILHILNNH